MRAGILVCALLALLAISACAAANVSGPLENGGAASTQSSSAHVSANQPQHGTFDLEDIPDYAGRPSVDVNGGVPYFAGDELTLEPFETYSALDSLGRCGVAYALVGPETMPDAKRGSIGMIKPSGWHTAKYDWVDGKYLFNRCHLIAYGLAGENDNPQNLITGTRSMNAQGMLPYEERAMDYIRSTGNHVLYRVTPHYDGDNLVASGVLMEARSVEDDGAGLMFCVWCYNVEPGVEIDYATGDNWASDPSQESAGAVAGKSGGIGGAGESSAASSDPESMTYILNTNTHRFHYPDCKSVGDMKEKNKQEVVSTRSELIENGYKPCGVCKP